MQNGNLIMGITGDIERLDAAIIYDTAKLFLNRSAHLITQEIGADWK